MSENNQNLSHQQEQIPQKQQNQLLDQQLKQEFIGEQQQQYFEQILQNIDKMHQKLKLVRSSMSNQGQTQPVLQTHKIAETLLIAKQNSQIVVNQNLSKDVGLTLENNIVDIYTKNQLLKGKIQQLAKQLVQRNKKIYFYQQKYQREVEKNQRLQKQIDNLKNKHTNVKQEKPKHQQLKKQKSREKIVKNKNLSSQNEDYDFWNADPSQNFKKKSKDAVQDSGLWINQKNGSDKGTFVTQELKKKK